ncbi:hypothetical protein PMAC_002963 [Pneumocystis sp. 'macacae']|nr:hypothetical protein PMAC_002963 [Pneumocystis sp. 'macacae']
MKEKNEEISKDMEKEKIFFSVKNRASEAEYKTKQENKRLNNSEEERGSNGTEKEREFEESDETKSHSLNNGTEDGQNTSYDSTDTVFQKRESQSSASMRGLSTEVIFEKQKQEYETEANKCSEKKKHSNIDNSVASVNQDEEEYTVHDENQCPLKTGSFLPKQKTHTHREPLEPLSTHKTHALSFIQPSDFGKTSLPETPIDTYTSIESSTTQETLQQPLSMYKARISTNILQKKFEEIYQNASSDKTIDWGRPLILIISDYNFVVKTHKEELSNAISTGIPPILRGILWQTMTSSKNSDMEHIYHTLINQHAPTEKSIQKDLYKIFPKATLKAMSQYPSNI